MSEEDNFHLGVKALIFNQENKMLLLKLNPRKWDLVMGGGQVTWDLPGGRMHKGETPQEALKREVQEETGLSSIENIQSVSMDLTELRIPVGAEDVGLIYLTYSCQVGEDLSIQLSHEHHGYTWASPSEAGTMLPPDFPSGLRSKLLSWPNLLDGVV